MNDIDIQTPKQPPFAQATGSASERPVNTAAKPPKIQLRCPECGRKKRVDRDATDPAGAVVAEIPCDRCDNGGGFPTTAYFDAEGRELFYSAD